VLEKRADEPEFTENPNCDPNLARRAYAGMAVFNRGFGGVRVVRQFVREQLEKIPAGKTIRVLDLGSGPTDIPLAVSRWARRRGHRVEFTGLDHSELAVQLARDKIAQADDPNVRVIHANVFEYRPDEPFDCAVGSMFFHHFTNDQIVQLVRHLQPFVRNTLLISDLLRYTPIYLIVRAGTVFLSPELRHDILASIRRGFKLTELRHLFADLEGATVSTRRDRFFRAVAQVRFSQNP